ncbi:MAG: HAMP domain-containing sensor histidine kinase [Candidatus Tenebribacter burtonii]|nr:HAMP domain-containing sensor histidine kinase [Candidatus Tenebribacter burtonii]
MKSGKLQKKASKRNLILKIYFIAGSVLLLVLFIIFTNVVINNVKKDVQIVPDLYSKFVGMPADVNLEQFLFQYFMEEILPGIDYPIILTDSLKSPFSWENIDIPKDDFNQLETRQQNILINMVKKMESKHSMIPLKISDDDDKIYSYVFYGDSQTMIQLKMMPYVGMGFIFLYIFLGMYGVYTIKKTERDILWVGLAKETAHQFGTPLSSLGGWIDVLYPKMVNCKNGKKLQDMLNFMHSDVERLSKIASRFGKVGSVLKFQSCSLHNIIEETIEYFEQRLPVISNKIEIKFESEIKDKKINLDPDLIKWTLENMFKNCIDSMKKKGGIIGVKAFSHKNKMYIHIADEGNGMPKKMFKKIFRPGVTNKERGWGLGLSLARRIVEEYHNGKIRVLESDVEVGTTFEIVLPKV